MAHFSMPFWSFQFSIFRARQTREIWNWARERPFCTESAWKRRVLPGTRRRAWGSYQCGRCRAESRCWRAWGPSITILQRPKRGRCSYQKNTWCLCSVLFWSFIFLYYFCKSSSFFKIKVGGWLPSLMAVHGAPSSCSRRISFSATRLSVSLLRPLNTVA